MKQLFAFLLILLFGNLLFSQETKPCTEYHQPKNSYSIHEPKTLPIFPGCESYKENNDSLNICTRNFIGSKINQKLGTEFSPEVKNDNTKSYYKVSVIMEIDYRGKLEMKIQDKKQNPFENQLEEKLNEISNETVGIIPAKMENGECVKFKYSLPIFFDLTDSEYQEIK